jgi:hypothetical protein
MHFMKFLHAFTFALIFLSCKKNKEPDAILPRNDTITLWAGHDTVITIPGALLTYTVTSDNDEVAHAVVANNRVTISTDIPGNTIVRLKDETNRTIELKVYAKHIAGKWYRAEGTLQMPPKVEVTSNDPAFTETLKNGLMEEALKPVGVYYMLELRGPNPMSFRELLSGRLGKEGTYSYRNLTLTMVYNGVTTVFRVIPVDGENVGLEQDMTATYQQLHPDKGITKVTVIKYLKVYMNPG